ncbi:MAG: phage tail protein I [Sphingobium sp.]|uniref:phage tail protein I n=1 Tax=Sphingobium sp. TaxID=1912891 RepID=UPI003BAE8AD3
MTEPAHLLPPNATPFERAMSLAGAARIDAVPIAVDRLWNPQTCPADLLPWLAWGLSADIWDPDWSEAQKRAAIAAAIDFQRRKGTPASLRSVLDRFDPLIEVVEWFEARDLMAPYHFWTVLPTLADSDTVFDDLLVAKILRDIAQLKPVRAHMTVIYRLRAEAQAWLVSPARLAGLSRLQGEADVTSATEDRWDTYLQTSDGEPILTMGGDFMEVD